MGRPFSWVGLDKSFAVFDAGNGSMGNTHRSCVFLTDQPVIMRAFVEQRAPKLLFMAGSFCASAIPPIFFKVSGDKQTPASSSKSSPSIAVSFPCRSTTRAAALTELASVAYNEGGEDG